MTSETHGFGHAAASLIFVTNPGINLLLAEVIQPWKSNTLGLGFNTAEQMSLFPPILEGHFFPWIYGSRMSSLPVAPHTVQHQDGSAQAVTGSMGRAEDLAECSCFVLPSGYLERQGKTKWVPGTRCPRSTNPTALASHVQDTLSVWLCARN